MGGANAMKAVAKVTRTLPVNGGARQLKLENHHPISVAAVSARSLTEKDTPLMASSSQSQEVTAGEPSPRVISTGLPTLQEARETTSELSHAGRLFLASSNSVRREDVAVADSHLPTGAMQAFQLLMERPQVQNTVSSIVADSNVWNAVTQNHDLQDLLQSRRSLATSILDQPSLGTIDDNTSFKSFTNFLRTMKGIVVDVMDSMIRWFVLFKNSIEDDGSTKFDSSDNLVKLIVGLVVSVIMIILTKRIK